MKLDKVEMPTKKFGKVPRPHFEIVGWDEPSKDIDVPPVARKMSSKIRARLQRRSAVRSLQLRTAVKAGASSMLTNLRTLGRRSAANSTGKVLAPVQAIVPLIAA